LALEVTALTDAIDAAFKTEWGKIKSAPLSDAGGEDRRLLFAAVARGLLEYLSEHQEELVLSVKATKTGGAAEDYSVESISLDIQT
jgi:hypothetical protein